MSAAGTAPGSAGEECASCGAPAAWLRATQFAGDHPFCDAHARAEKGFGTNDSHACWEALPAAAAPGDRTASPGAPAGGTGP